MNHETMSKEYITPTAEYLSSLYGITMFEASSIAWRGVMSTEAYKTAKEFAIKEDGVVTLYTKSEIQDKGIHYLLESTGKKNALKN